MALSKSDLIHFSCKINRNCVLKAPLADQRGMVLILAITMLAILSVLGMLALSTTDTELNLSGNFKTSQMAFFSAQRAVEYAMTNGDIFETIGTGEADLETSNHLTNIEAGTGYGLVSAVGNNTITFQAAGVLPPGSGSDPTLFETRYYLIDVTGAGPNNSQARIETQIGRIVPK